MSGQYSSYLGASGAETIKWTERSRYLDTRESTSSWSDVAIAPSGQVIRTGGKGRPVRGLSTYSARNSNIRAHFLGFLALTTIPVDGSSRAYDRSPKRPRSVRSDASSSSPNMDFTGYRHKEANCPAASSEEFIGPSRSYRCAESVDGTSKFRVETRMTKAESRPYNSRGQASRHPDCQHPTTVVAKWEPGSGNPLAQRPESEWTWDDSQSGHTRRFAARMCRGSARSKIKYHAARHSFDEASVGELLPHPVRLTRSPNPRRRTRRLPFRRPAARQHSPMTCRREAEVPGPARRSPTRPPRPWHSPCPASHPESRRPPRPPREKGERSSKSTRRSHARPPRRPVQYRRRL